MKPSVFYHHLLSISRETGRPIADVLTETRELGFEGIECDYSDFSADPAGFARLLADVRLEAASVYVFLDFPKGERTAHLQQILNDVHSIGCRKLLAVPAKIEHQTPEDTDAICRGLNDLCSMARDLDITVAVEDFDSDRSPCGSPEKLEALFARVPLLGFTLDTGNFLYLDRDVLQCIPKLLPRLAHMHLKDRSFTPFVPGASGMSTVGGTMIYDVPVGTGDIPMARLLHIAKEQGYDGWCSAEHFDAADQSRYLRLDAAWLKEHL